MKIGDRVLRVDLYEKATIIDIYKGLYVLHFDNEEYEDLICDEEKLVLIGSDSNDNNRK